MNFTIPDSVRMEAYERVRADIEATILRTSLMLGIDIEGVDLGAWDPSNYEILEQNQPLMDGLNDAISRYKLVAQKIEEIDVPVD